MGKSLRLILLAVLILVPLIFYHFAGKKDREPIFLVEKNVADNRPQIALVFDDLGDSLQEIKDLYSFKIPITASVIPGLKFSRNVAHIADRCGYTVFIHLPLGPKDKSSYDSRKLRVITSDLSKREINSLLAYYLSSIKIAYGANNHMGSAATEDARLMKLVMKELKERDLVFIDSKTSLKSIACETAQKENVDCAVNDGFLDSVDTVAAINKKLDDLVALAKKKGKIIIIAHPRSNTISVLKSRLPKIKKEIKFITAQEYFE